MVICPNCKKKIGYLYSNATATTGCSMDEDGVISLDNIDLEDSTQTDEWGCPECYVVVAWDEGEAKIFLKDKDELQEIIAEKVNGDKEDG